MIRRFSSALAVATAVLLSASAASAGSTNYTYDALGRLVQVTMSSGIVVTYAYDAAGNRTQVTSTGGPYANLVVIPLLGGAVIPLAQTQ